MSLPGFDFQSRYFTHPNGLKQHYIDQGQGSPVLMLHGNPSWSYYYRRMIAGLSKQHRCIVPDHIGMGWSDKPNDQQYAFRLQQRVADLDALCDHLIASEGLPDRGWTLIVHDWGGMIGFAHAVKHHARFSKLVVLNTGAFLNPKQLGLPFTLRLGRDSWLGEFLIRGFNAFARGAVRYGTLRKMDPAEKAALLSPYNSWANRISTARFVQDIPLRPEDPGYALVKETSEKLAVFANTPMQIHWGRHDFVFDDAFLATWQRHFPNALTRVYEDAGHYVLEDAHERIVPAVQAFLGTR